MKFALKNGNRRKAELSGDIAQCICCGLSVRAYIKDDERKLRLREFNNQWRHINNMCDKWWESETEWHRCWKGKFPDDWQEFVMVDRLTGEKHIADVFTIGRKEEVIIEFQNSKISEQEVKSREEFYKKMIWVVNASSFGIILGDSVDRENNDSDLLNEYENLKTFINSFYDKNSGEAYSYKARTVPFDHIDFEKCINVIEWYSENRGRSDKMFQEEFEKFKLAILEYPTVKKRLDKYVNKIKEKGYFDYHCEGSNFWAMAKAPVFFDIDGNLYRIIPNEGEKKCDVTEDDDIELEYPDDDEWDYGDNDDEWDYDDEFSGGGVVKKYSHEQFIYHYRNIR